MFSRIGIWEVLLIVVALLFIFGPSKLPQLGRAIGDTMKEFKKGVKAGTDEEGDKNGTGSEKKA